MNLPVIETTRLRLRPLSLFDLDDIHRLWADPDIRRYLFDDEVISRGQAESEVIASLDCFEKGGYGLWGVFLKTGGKMIGFCGYRFFHDPPELQLLYGLEPGQWGRGLAAEAARALIRYGFEELSFTRIVASADAPNSASLRVMERAGMTFEKRADLDGKDTVYYALEREHFQSDGSPYSVVWSQESPDRPESATH